MVAPTLSYTPAPFNMAFPGTVSISNQTFERLALEVTSSLLQHGFEKIYFLNGHGANIAPLKAVIAQLDGGKTGNIRLRSWWDFDAVNILRREYYDDWEGMHATPSEVAITQATHRQVVSDLATEPPRKLTAQYIADHSGDRHGPPQQHRRNFPDGRVGSHSALATPKQGAELLRAAVKAVADDYSAWARAKGC